MEQVDRWLEDKKDELMATLRSWIAVPSVKDAPAEDAPFGKEVRRMLDLALADAARMGFATRDIGHYAGDVRMGPEGVEPLGVLAHLDVVPVGDGWSTDPFEATLAEDRVYGRGTSDDKGPALAALFAMRALRECGLPLKREVRLILGCDEESGWEDMAYYREHCDMPRTGFSPDASFPVINTEKGLLHLSLRAPAASDGLHVHSICVGERCNVIPGFASALISGSAELAETINRLAREMTLSVTATVQEEGLLLLEATGIPGHAAYPETARNAIGMLLLALRAHGVTGALKTLADCVGLEYNGDSLGVKCSDEASGPLTCNLGILRYDEKGLYATLDIRYPLLANPEAIKAALTAALGDAFTITVDEQKAPHHVAPNSELVTALLDAYHDETGRPRECVATGGGTYARCLNEGVAFGAAFPEDPDVAHQAGEYIELDKLMQSARIYARAIAKLACAEPEL